MTAELLRLTEGHPPGRGKAPRHALCPEQEDIDAGIGRAVVAKGTRDSARHAAGVPGLEPGPHALFEVGNDPVRDAGIEIRSASVTVMGFSVAVVFVLLARARPVYCGFAAAAAGLRRGLRGHGS